MNLLEAASILVANAELTPDPRMKGTTDAYLVTLDDMDALFDALKAALSALAVDGWDHRTAREHDRQS